jgi:hypothetical protein
MNTLIANHLPNTKVNVAKQSQLQSPFQSKYRKRATQSSFKKVEFIACPEISIGFMSKLMTALKEKNLIEE